MTECSPLLIYSTNRSYVNCSHILSKSYSNINLLLLLASISFNLVRAYVSVRANKYEAVAVLLESTDT
jgi:hypothetical protein